jgi:aminopeptidase
MYRPPIAATDHVEAGAILSADELERYAEAIVHACLGLHEDDLLIVRALPVHQELAVALAEAGYRAGARLVELAYGDPLVRAARIRHARDEDLGPVPPWELSRFRAGRAPDVATVFVLPESEPGAFDGLPAARVAADYTAWARRLQSVRRDAQAGFRRATVVAWPTEDWAAQAYPEVDALEGRRRLATDLLWFCRLGPDDPPHFDGWTRHAAALTARARALTELGLARLEIRDRGTSLDLCLVPGTRWLGGPRENAHGRMVTGNFPTEESFTSPEARSTAGMFRCSRPLFFRGRTIEGIAGEFRSGRLVRLAAANDDDREFLAAALDADSGARRLGEVALVDRSSRIGQTGRVYRNTLIDENAAAHMAFGYGFDQSRLPLEGASGRRGVNRSSLHLDVMIGTDELEATGVTVDGRRLPLIADGAWQVP